MVTLLMSALLVFMVPMIALSSAPHDRSITASELTCSEFVIVNAGAIASFPTCVDTIVVSTMFYEGALPGRHPESRDSSPGSIFIEHHRNGSTEYEQIPAHWLVHSTKPIIYAILDRPLSSRMPDMYQTLFTIQIHCEYWFGPNQPPNTQYATVNDMISLSTRARSLDDSSDISDSIDGFESIQDITVITTQEFNTEAPATSGPWVFSHWTSTHASQMKDLTQPTLRIVGGCWPSAPPQVHCTAWYRRPTTVGHAERMHKPRLRADGNDLYLDVDPTSAPITFVSVADLRGSLVAHKQPAEPLTSLHLPFYASPGLYLVTVRCGDNLITLPYSHLP